MWIGLLNALTSFEKGMKTEILNKNETSVSLLIACLASIWDWRAQFFSATRNLSGPFNHLHGKAWAIKCVLDNIISTVIHRSINFKPSTTTHLHWKVSFLPSFAYIQVHVQVHIHGNHIIANKRTWEQNMATRQTHCNRNGKRRNMYIIEQWHGKDHMEANGAVLLENS